MSKMAWAMSNTLRPVGLRVAAEEIEAVLVGDSVALHEDALGAFDHRAAAEGAFEVVEVRETAQHDVDRALDLRGLTMGDVRENASLRGLAHERGVVGMEQGDHGARRLLDDSRDVVEGVLGALAQADERNIGSLLPGQLAHLFDIELTSDDCVAHLDHDTRQKLETLGAFVRDQNTEVLALRLTLF